MNRLEMHRAWLRREFAKAFRAAAKESADSTSTWADTAAFVLGWLLSEADLDVDATWTTVTWRRRAELGLPDPDPAKEPAP